MNQSPFITFKDVAVRLGERWVIEDARWQIRQGEHWVIWGPNGAGKTSLANTLMGTTAVVRGNVVRHYLEDAGGCGGRVPMALFSAEQYHHLYQHEQLLDEMRHFSGRGGDATRAADWWDAAVAGAQTSKKNSFLHRIVELFDIERLRPKPVVALSSGETRKLLLARTLLADPCLLILDEPFNGLDADSQRSLTHALTRLAQARTQMVLITHRRKEIAGFFSHVLEMDQGRLIWQGTREAFLARVVPSAPNAAIQPAGGVLRQSREELNDGMPLIRMAQVCVRFGEHLILDRVDWTVRPGENWALIGPNGAGKSTLLALITGDQLQAYANQILLFGRPKGSGESVWEIKQYIGFVGDTLQVRYQRAMSGLDVVCSGFFDSVGLYRHCSPDQRRRAEQWVQTLGLADLAGQRMARLSFGQQRLILIARAMVKTPRLLILDEPCNGLDSTHRARLLGLLETIGRGGTTQLLYVSHRADEIPICITHRLFLERGKVVGVQGPNG
ncbi:MAG: ATP-binding cassette domain-containing protein [Desulfobacteraceae bacterium]|nr:ATP-binding cassette domain-containing protein [Desulfobacteraceae bacterium]